MMDFIIKTLPFLPEEKDTPGLIKAILYHAIVFVIASSINIFLCMILIGILFIPVIFVYTLGGIALSIMSYLGTDVSTYFSKKDDSAE